MRTSLGLNHETRSLLIGATSHFVLLGDAYLTSRFAGGPWTEPAGLNVYDP